MKTVGLLLWPGAHESLYHSLVVWLWANCTNFLNPFLYQKKPLQFPSQGFWWRLNGMMYIKFLVWVDTQCSFLSFSLLEFCAKIPKKVKMRGCTFINSFRYQSSLAFFSCISTMSWQWNCIPHDDYILIIEQKTKITHGQNILENLLIHIWRTTILTLSWTKLCIMKCI